MKSSPIYAACFNNQGAFFWHCSCDLKPLQATKNQSSAAPTFRWCFVDSWAPQGPRCKIWIFLTLRNVWWFGNPQKNHRWDVWNPVKNGIFKPYQLVSRIVSINSMYLFSFFQDNSWHNDEWSLLGWIFCHCFFFTVMISQFFRPMD